VTDSKRKLRRSKGEAQARAEQAFELSLTGLGWRDIARQLGYGNPGNAWRAAQRFIDGIPDQGNTNRRRSIAHQHLGEVWRLAHPRAVEGDTAAMRVMVEVIRTRAQLDGLNRPTVLQIDNPGDTQQQVGPTLRDVLPPEVVAADPRTVRQQALALHLVLPRETGEQAG
jgi:hypothetical protein